MVLPPCSICVVAFASTGERLAAFQAAGPLSLSVKTLALPVNSAPGAALALPVNFAPGAAAPRRYGEVR
jgi:hypothetical protein